MKKILLLALLAVMTSSVAAYAWIPAYDADDPKATAGTGMNKAGTSGELEQKRLRLEKDKDMAKEATTGSTMLGKASKDTGLGSTYSGGKGGVKGAPAAPAGDAAAE